MSNQIALNAREGGAPSSGRRKSDVCLRGGALRFEDQSVYVALLLFPFAVCSSSLKGKRVLACAVALVDNNISRRNDERMCIEKKRRALFAFSSLRE